MSFPRTYLLGAGSIGSFVANELKQFFGESIPLVLLLSNEARQASFKHANSTIKVVSQKNLNVQVSESQFESDFKPPRDSTGSPFPIDNLIISTKSYHTQKAIQPYLPHLSRTSNVLLLQNGMGMAEKLSESFWTNERPNIFQAVVTHGAYRTSPYTVHFTSPGKISIACVPPKEGEVKVVVPDFIQAIIDTPNLNATEVPYEQHLLLQMEKLVANACINPLTSILDCLNGDLLYGDTVIPIMRNVIREAVDVFYAEFEILKTIPEARTFLDKERLLEYVLGLCISTKSNSSSMREDVRNMNTTEISAINGYLVELGRKNGVYTPLNKMLISLVKAKLSINRGVDKSSLGRHPF